MRRLINKLEAYLHLNEIPRSPVVAIFAAREQGKVKPNKLNSRRIELISCPRAASSMYVSSIGAFNIEILS